MTKFHNYDDCYGEPLSVRAATPLLPLCADAAQYLPATTYCRSRYNTNTSPRAQDNLHLLITTTALTKRYAEVTALDALDIELDEGIIGLVGSNGAGKSTFIKLLLGLVEPTTAPRQRPRLRRHRPGADLRQFVGYMPEHDCLPTDATATEFVAHMAQISGLPAPPPASAPPRSCATSACSRPATAR